MPAQTVIKLRRDSSANWETANPVLSAGEPGLDIDTNQLKLGDGVTEWIDLPYTSGAGGRVEVSATAPEDAEEGTIWYDSTIGVPFIYYDNFWVELAPAIAPPATTVAVTAPLTNTGDEQNVVLGIDQSQLAGVSHNYIINGAFDVNQRAFTSVVSGGFVAVYHFDRWRLTGSGSLATVTPQVFTPGTAPLAGLELANFLRLNSSTDELAVIGQPVEDVRTLAGQTATISFYAKAASGTPKIAIELDQQFGAGGSARVTTYAGQVTLSTSWQRLTATVSVPSISGKTIGTSSSLTLNLFASASSAFDARTGSLGLQNNTFDIAGVQLEAGSVATPFKRHAPSLQGELAACRRFARRYEAQGNPFARYGLGIVDSAADVQVPFLEWAEMRTYPTQVITSGTADFFVETAGGGYAVSTIALSNGNSLRFRATGAPANGVALVRGNNAASAFFVVSSEL
jgi:hypothetical protein